MNNNTRNTPSNTNADEPKLNKTGPMMPPIKACDDDIGRPSHVQIPIHDVAPIKAQNTTYGFIYCASTSPRLIVSATCELKMKYAMNPQNAAQATAFNGVKTRVVIMHDTASAASFMPFKNVINNANINEAATINANISGILNDDGSYSICNILQNIARAFKCLGNILVLDQLDIISLVIE